MLSLQENLFSRFYGISIGLSIVYFFLYLIFPLRYETSDDATMMLISSGYFSNSPDYHLIFINVILGFLITSFENLLPHYNWYAIILLTIHIISFTSIFYLLNKVKLQKAIHLIFTILILLCFLYVSVNMQFTFNAAIATVAGLMFLWLRKNNFYYVFGVILFAVGTMIRFESSIVILLFFSISYFLFIKNESSRFKILLITSLIAILGTLDGVNNFLYSYNSTEWAEYNQYNDIRKNLNNNSQFRNLKDYSPHKFDANKNQLDLFYNFFADPNYFDLQRLKSIKVVVDNSNKDYRYMFRLIDFIIPLVLITTLCFIIIYCINREKRRKDAVVLFILLSLFVCLLLYINIESRVNDRAFFALTFSLFLPILMVLNKTILMPKAQFKIITIVSLLMVFIGFLCVKSLVVSQIALKDTKKISVWISGYTNRDIYIFPGKSLGTRSFKILENDPYFKELNFKFAGWIVGAPFEKNVLDDYRKLLDEKSVLVIHKTHSEYAEKLIAVFSEVYFLNVRKITLSEFEGIEIIKFIEE